MILILHGCPRFLITNLLQTLTYIMQVVINLVYAHDMGVTDLSFLLSLVSIGGWFKVVDMQNITAPIILLLFANLLFHRVGVNVGREVNSTAVTWHHIDVPCGCRHVC